MPRTRSTRGDDQANPGPAGAAALSPCGALLRRSNRDLYLVALFARPVLREVIFTVFAFSAELGRIAATVSEPMLGQIRLQWWREAVDRIFDGAAGGENEVLTSLAELRHRTTLDRALFHQAIDAAEAALLLDTVADLDALARRCEVGQGPLFRQCLLTVDGLDQDPTMAELAVGTGLVAALRSLPNLAGRRRTLVPESLIRAHQVDLTELFALRPHPGLADALCAMAHAASDHLDRAAAGRPQRGSAARVLHLAEVPARHFLRRLRAADYDIFAASKGKPSGSLVWRLAARHYVLDHLR